MQPTLTINEVYLSLQGESSWAGWPCIFVRLTACNLRCSYCDTAYAFTAGRKVPLDVVRTQVHQLATPFRPPHSALRIPHSAFRTPYVLPLVELTGGEPLLQSGSLPLMESLCDDGFTVLLETSGALDIAPVDPRVHRIMDLKCPSSGEVERNRWDNVPHLQPTDEIKFVIGTQEDYEWTKQQIVHRGLAERCPLVVSSVNPLGPAPVDPALKPVPAGQTPLTRQQLAERILADALPVRFQLQMHKFIWPAEQRGV